MTSLRRASRSLLALVAATGLACEGPTSVRYGTLDLLLTDAPGDVVSAVVTIDQIYLQPGEDGTDGRIVLRDDDVTVDLMTLANTTASLISGVAIPVGSYSQLRFVISGAYIEVEGEEGGEPSIFASSPDYAGLPEGVTADGSLQLPSWAHSGLKVQLPFDAVVIAVDETVTLVVDFDVSQSFGRLAGGSGGWVLSPVIKAEPPPPPAP